MDDDITAFESRVAGVDDAPVRDIDRTLAELAMVLKGRVRRGEWKLVELFVNDALLGTDDSGAVRFPRELLLDFARAYGGRRKLVDDLFENPNASWVTSVGSEVRRRVGLEPLSVELERARFLEMGEANVQLGQAVIRPVAKVVTGAVAFELLAELKQWNRETADALADDGHVVLATLLATVDYFVPETGFDLGLAVFPITGGSVVVSRLGESLARRFPATAGHFRKLGQALTKDLAPEIRKLYNRARKQDPQSLRALVKLDEYASGQPFVPSREVPVVTGELNAVGVLKGDQAASVLPPTPGELLSGRRGPSPLARGDRAAFDRVMQKMMTRFANRCRQELVPPPSSAAKGVKVSWLERNGEVVQVIESRLARRQGQRREIIGFDHREHYQRAHLVPDVLDGDPFRYNLVYTPSRINQSLQKPIDDLFKDSVEGAVVRIEVVFENWERAWKRWPKPGQDAFHYELLRPGQKTSELGLPWAYTNDEVLKLGPIFAALRKALDNARRYGAQPSQHGGPSSMGKMMRRLDAKGNVKPAFD